MVLRREGHDHNHHAVLGQAVPIAHNNAAHLAHAAAVHQDRAGGHRVFAGYGLLCNFDYFSVFADDHIFRLNAHHFADLRVLYQHTVLAVNGDEVLGLCEGKHHLLLLLGGVAGHMQIGMPVIDDLCALVEKLVHHTADHILVAGNGGGGDNDPVSRVDTHLFMLGECHAVKGGHGLTLAAGGDDDHLVFGELVDMLDIHHHIFRDIHIAKHSGNPEHIFHAAPGYGHLAVIFCRHVHDLLEPVDIGGKGGDDDALIAAHEQLVEALPHLALRVGMSRLFHVGRVAEQGKYAVIAQLAQPDQVDHSAGYGRNVDLEVAGVDYRAQRRADGQGHGVRNAVVHMNKLNGKAAQAENRSGFFREDLGVVQQIMLL